MGVFFFGRVELRRVGSCGRLATAVVPARSSCASVCTVGIRRSGLQRVRKYGLTRRLGVHGGVLLIFFKSAKSASGNGNVIAVLSPVRLAAQDAALSRR